MLWEIPYLMTGVEVQFFNWGLRTVSTLNSDLPSVPSTAISNPSRDPSSPVAPRRNVRASPDRSGPPGDVTAGTVSWLGEPCDVDVLVWSLTRLIQEFLPKETTNVTDHSFGIIINRTVSIVGESLVFCAINDVGRKD